MINFLATTKKLIQITKQLRKVLLDYKLSIIIVVEISIDLGASANNIEEDFIFWLQFFLSSTIFQTVSKVEYEEGQIVQYK